ncbi:MAG: electron transfer flavoprotein subunit beta/FixA family protein [Brevinema sp.]
MKITVCIKQVPDTAEVRLDPKTGAMIRDGVISIMNPDDKAGLEEALKLKEQFKAEITVLTMGPPQAELILREALAMGVDHAILLTDRKFAGADTLATSNALSAALKILNPDLIITGRQAIDGDTAQVGPQIAELLELPQVSYVHDISTKDGKTFTVKRAIENGYQMIKVSTPCLFTLLSDANTPRYMNIAGIVDAYDKTIEVWDAAKVQIPDNKIGLAGSPTKVYKSFTKGAKSSREIHEVSSQEAVTQIVAKLKEIHII